MTNEQINAAIAEACGWTDFSEHPDWGTMAIETGTHRLRTIIPSYTTDLNWMHEAEKTLTDDQFKWYTYWVEKLMPETKYRCYLCATARQRAEAFVRSLGKWATTEDSSVVGKEVQP